MGLSLGDILVPGIMERGRKLEDRERMLALQALMARASQPEMFEGVAPAQATPQDIALYEKAFGIPYPQGAGLPRAPIAQKIYEMTRMAAPTGQAGAAETLTRLRALETGGLGELLKTRAKQTGEAKAAEELAQRGGLLEGGLGDILRQEEIASGQAKAAGQGAYLEDYSGDILGKEIQAWKRKAAAEHEFKFKAGETERQIEAGAQRIKNAQELIIKLLKQENASPIIQALALSNPRAISESPEITQFFKGPGVPPEVKGLFNQAVAILKQYYGPYGAGTSKGWKQWDY